MSYEPDEYEIAAAQRVAEYQAARTQTIANIQVYRAQGDLSGMGEEIDRLAEIDAHLANIGSLHARHQQSKMPRCALPLTPEEKAAKPLGKMDWSDTWEIASKSKYGCDSQAFQRGIAEVMARRARGE